MASLICPRRSSGQAARDGNRDRDPHPNETEGPGAVTRATSAGSAHPTQAKAAAVTGQAVTRGFAAAKPEVCFPLLLAVFRLLPMDRRPAAARGPVPSRIAVLVT
jgi:hypothetical protein